MPPPTYSSGCFASAIRETISRAVARSSDGLRKRARVGLEPRKQARVHFRGKYVHRNVHQHRTRLPALGQQERLVDDLREELRIVDAPGALHERPVDFVLRAVGMQVHFLVRVFAEIVRGHIAGDDHHRNAIERGIGHAGRGVGEPGTQVRQQHRRLARDARVAVGGVRGHLLVAHVDEFDAAARHGGQHGDVGVAAQAEHVAHAALLQVAHQVIGDGVFHYIVSVLKNSPNNS